MNPNNNAAVMGNNRLLEMPNKMQETMVIPPEIMPNPSGISSLFFFAKSLPFKEVFIFGIHLNVHINASIDTNIEVHIVYKILYHL